MGNEIDFVEYEESIESSNDVSDSRHIQIPRSLKQHLKRFLKFKQERGEAITSDSHLFIGQRGPWTSQAIQQIVKKYAEEAGVRATPHTFRHQAITWLTRHSGMADAELQLITGHSRRETLAVYQHIALDGDLERKYQDTMKNIEL